MNATSPLVSIRGVSRAFGDVVAHTWRSPDGRDPVAVLLGGEIKEKVKDNFCPAKTLEEAALKAAGANETVPSEGGFLLQEDFNTSLLNLIHTDPGITGRVGKCPGKCGSLMVTFFKALMRTPFSISNTRSTSKNGYRCGSCLRIL